MCKAIRTDGFGFKTGETALKPIAGTTTIGTLSIGSADAVIFECSFPASTTYSWLGVVEF
jgi:hypothetical protein